MKIIEGIQNAKLTISKYNKISNHLDSDQNTEFEKVVTQIIKRVKKDGDSALRFYAQSLDNVTLEQIEVDSKVINDAANKVPKELLDALEKASDRITAFHKESMPQGWSDTKAGYGSIVRAVEKAGLYIPGGTALYPSTVLMSAIPAKIAGVSEVVMCTPTKTGLPHEYILAAAKIADVDRIFTIGGAQAIAAMAYGTETVPKVDLICGPGNIFVTLAKKHVYGDVGIDGIYGPTETMIVADETADPELCIYDLMAQAEHDELSIPTLVTTSQQLAEFVHKSWKKLAEKMERKPIICASMENRGSIVIVSNLSEAIELVNIIAPEHVSLVTKSPHKLIPDIRNAGMVFVGENSHEVLGDYTAGPSHVMPTSNSARYSSGLGVQSFIKHIPVVDFGYETADPLNNIAATIARAEGFTAHAKAAEVRKKLNK
ncbi:MAG: histidinol dehydrogenase [Dehalococcoidia bacterium]